MKEVKIELKSHLENGEVSCCVLYGDKYLAFEMLEPDFVYMLKNIEIAINKLLNE